jgi:hypothetical protein
MKSRKRLWLAIIVIGAAMFLPSWIPLSQWLFGPCSDTASCAYALPFYMRLAGLVLIALGCVGLAAQWASGRRRAPV